MRDQHADALAPHRLQLLDVHHQAAVALDQQHLAVAARRGDADRGRQPGADRAEVGDDVVALRRPAAQMRQRDAEVVPAADHDVPVLRDDGVELHDRLARIDHAGGDGEFLAVRLVGGDRRGQRRCAEAGLRHAPLAQRRGDGRGPGRRIRPHMQVRRPQPLPQPARVDVDLHDLRVRERGSRPRSCRRRARRRCRSPGRPRRIARARSRRRRRRRCRGSRGCRRTGPWPAARSRAARRIARPAPPPAPSRRASLAPRPAMMIGFSLSAIICTSRVDDGRDRAAAAAAIGR